MKRDDPLLAIERERLLELELGVGERVFWAALKPGGPVHCWHPDIRFVTPDGDRGSWFGSICNLGLQWMHRTDIGRKRRLVTVKRVCKKCREIMTKGTP